MVTEAVDAVHHAVSLRKLKRTSMPFHLGPVQEVYRGKVGQEGTASYGA